MPSSEGLSDFVHALLVVISLKYYFSASFSSLLLYCSVWDDWIFSSAENRIIYVVCEFNCYW